MLNLKSLLAQLDPTSSGRLELSSGRRPRIVSGAELKNLADEILTDDEVIEACRAAGAGRAVDDVGDGPVNWSMQGPKGPVRATIGMKGREVVATFTYERSRPSTAPQGKDREAKDREAKDRDREQHDRRTVPPRGKRSPSNAPGPKKAEPDPRRAITLQDRRRPTPAAMERAMAKATRRSEHPRVEAKSARQEPGPDVDLVGSPGRVEVQPLRERAGAREQDLATMREPLGGRDHKPFRPVRVDDLLFEALCEAHRAGASDLHVAPGHAASLRVCGALRPGRTRFSRADVDRAVASITTPAASAVFDRAGAATFAASVGAEIRVRVNATRTLAGSKLAIRLLPTEPKTLEELGLPPEVQKITELAQGLVVVAGPAGHGKTTSLAALVEHVNRNRAVHVVTVEDPVEIPIRSNNAVVSQREIGEHAKTAAAAIAAASKQDADVIAIGELRDLPTLRAAIAAASRGHLVFATMNASGAARAVERMIEMFPPWEQAETRATLATSLALVLAQRLVPTTSGKERVLVLELLPSSAPLSSLLREDKVAQLVGLMHRGRGVGIVRFEETLKRLVEKGVVSDKVAAEILEDAEPRSEPQVREEALKREESLSTQDERGLAGLLQKAGAIFTRKGES